MKPKQKKMVKPTDVPETLPEEESGIGVPVLFRPGEWDIEDELSTNPAFLEHEREQADIP